MKTISKILTALLIAVLMLGACAFAEEGNLSDDGETSMTLDNGLTVSFNKYNFKVDVDENGDLDASYLGDVKEGELVGFNVVRSEGTDAEAYMIEAAQSYGVDLDYGPCFGEEQEWYSFTNTTEEDGTTAVRTVYARNNSDGAWIVTAYSYVDDDEERNMDISDELSMVLDTLKFAD